MKLEYIALSVSDHKGIENFYMNIPGMEQMKKSAIHEMTRLSKQ